jgi:hypothetical protein
MVLALLWLVGVAGMLLRHVGGWRVVGGLEKQPFACLPEEWQRRVDRLCVAMRIGRDVSVRLSTTVVGPFTARWIRPVVWLPVSLLTQLPRDQLEALLAHELAHVARLDWLWNGLQCLVESLLFFHPAAWWLGRRIRIEREHACDDLAVAACGDAIALAEALVQLECRRQPVPRLVLAAHGGSLMQRITRLVSGPPSRGTWGTRAGIVLVLAVGTLVAAQVGMAGSGRSGLHIRSTTDGALGPGDMREITARGIDGDRYYRADVDAKGQRVEVYTRDGKPAPIDAGVRAWLAEIDRLSMPPPPPPPPPLPPQVPPPPPAPPPPPQITDSVAFQSLLRRVAVEPAVVARVGTPVAMASNAVDGSISIRDDTGASHGDADVSFVVKGPKGRATVDVEATLQNGAWTVDRIRAR